jgi:predicted dehydrogenase
MNVGIVGAGTIGRIHAEAYARQPNCAVVAVADVDAERGQRLAEPFGATYFPSLNHLLAGARVDAVSVCLPHALHAEAVLMAAAAGKHVLCEKPIATTLDDADRMIAACRESKVTLMIGHTHRFYPEHVRARQLLDEGAIGRVLFANDVIWAGHEGGSLQWRGSVALNGGGIFMDNGIHAADRLRWFLGSEVAWVTARTGRGRGIVEGEEHGTALLGFANGVTATLQEALGVPRSAGCCYVELIGTEGALRVDTWQGLRISQPGQPWQDVEIPKDWPAGFDAEIGEFVAAIREGRPSIVPGEEGRRSLALIQAIYRAAETGEVVRL